MTRFAVFLASFAYIGYFPVAPGTAGALAGLGVFALLHAAGIPAAVLAGTVLVIAAGVWSAGRAEPYFGTVDPGQVVIDEVAGMLVTLVLLPVSVPVVVAGFLLFRVFDIVKPWPANRLERWHGGAGVMADDVMCGVYANMVIRAALWVLSEGAP